MTDYSISIRITPPHVPFSMTYEWGKLGGEIKGAQTFISDETQKVIHLAPEAGLFLTLRLHDPSETMMGTYKFSLTDTQSACIEIVFDENSTPFVTKGEQYCRLLVPTYRFRTENPPSDC